MLGRQRWRQEYAQGLGLRCEESLAKQARDARAVVDGVNGVRDEPRHRLDVDLVDALASRTAQASTATAPFEHEACRLREGSPARHLVVDDQGDFPFDV